ncbi:hypothetical protein [Escherichia phage vB_EcoM_PiR]|nr:hypothetical protein [Escherichia phage vB_EcoM_IntR]UNY42519.1 hypothetical protein [Escherichia phage vB_EcoM_PiR]
MLSKEDLYDIARRVNQRDLSGVTDLFSAGTSDDAVLREAERRQAEIQRTASCWDYQPPKTVPLTWVDMTVWLLNKLGIRSK